MMDVVEKARLQGRTRAPHDLAFHAAWVRGGDLLLRAMEEMQEEDGNWRDARVRVCDYLMQFQAHPLVQNMGSIGKLELLGVLAECQYFVYPLVRFPDGEMHKDTFACVVAEACAMGAVVVTYPVAALPETYGDTVYWMDFPDEVKDVEHLKYKPLSHDTALLTTEPIKKALRYLESHPVEREAMRQRAAALVSEAYSPKAVGSMWVDFMSRLVHP
jgi:glycosyltransferase involved in cell wall biosynthesis